MSLRFGKIQDRQDVLQMNALQLAYLGDTVWELIVRYELINLKYNVRHMHKSCVEKVNANAQAQILRNILDVLTDEERSVVQRGRNAHPGHAAPRNHGSRGALPADRSEPDGRDGDSKAQQAAYENSQRRTAR